MALEYIVAGRRPLPEKRSTPWVWEFDMTDEASEAFLDAFDDGSFELCEIERADRTIGPTCDPQAATKFSSPFV
jgi:hypothetical protein